MKTFIIIVERIEKWIDYHKVQAESPEDVKKLFDNGEIDTSLTDGDYIDCAETLLEIVKKNE